MKPCISQACTLSSSFAEDVAAYAEGGCQAMEVWLTKLETHLETHAVSETKHLLADRQMILAAASHQGGLLLSQGESRKAHFDHFRRRLDLCQAFGIPTLILIPDFAEHLDQTALERSIVSLVEAARWAQTYQVRLALEFRGKASFCASLDTAIALIRACGEKNVGVCLDVFHYYTGPSKFEDLALLDKDSLFHVQVCDIAGIARELASDRDRILPGEGDFRLGPILACLREVQYDGWVSLELLNPTLWQIRPAHFAELGMKALERLLRS
jgi:sugar phosphate isomerase/epimerase